MDPTVKVFGLPRRLEISLNYTREYSEGLALEWELVSLTSFMC